MIEKSAIYHLKLLPCKYYLTTYYSEVCCFNVDKVDEQCNAITIDATILYKIQKIQMLF